VIFTAVDEMPEGGTLTVRTMVARQEHLNKSGPADVVHLEVCDTGTGMDDTTRRHCLEPFFTTKGERGTGLGLAMVYGIVQRHSADIEIESAPGKGTTVRLVFAATEGSAADTHQSAAPPAMPSRQHILIVDDDPLLLKSLRDTLETDGHLVVPANGG